jgi:tRNA (guanine-N7-)-methyltransferase
LTEGAGMTVAPIRTFLPRRGRLGVVQRRALDRLDLTIPDGPGRPLDLASLFGRRVPVVMEIGFGMGEATAAMAAANPDLDYLAVEVHTPGIAHLLRLIEQWGLRNVRVVRADAMQLLRHRIAPDSLAALHVFFPDPWPKARHRKRRLISPRTVPLLRSRLAVDGVLHCATDWPEYADAMRTALDGDPGLVAAGPRRRPATKFERRGLAAGRPVVDLVYQRRS